MLIPDKRMKSAMWNRFRAEQRRCSVTVFAYRTQLSLGHQDSIDNKNRAILSRDINAGHLTQSLHFPSIFTGHLLDDLRGTGRLVRPLGTLVVDAAPRGAAESDVPFFRAWPDFCFLSFFIETPPSLKVRDVFKANCLSKIRPRRTIDRCPANEPGRPTGARPF